MSYRLFWGGVLRLSQRRCSGSILKAILSTHQTPKFGNRVDRPHISYLIKINWSPTLPGAFPVPSPQFPPKSAALLRGSYHSSQPSFPTSFCGKVAKWVSGRGSVAIVQTVRLPSVRLVRSRGFASFIVGLQIVSSLLEQEALSEVLIYSSTKRDGVLNLSPLIGRKIYSALLIVKPSPHLFLCGMPS